MIPKKGGAMKNYFLFCIILSSLALIPSDETRALWNAIRKGPVQRVTKAVLTGGIITEQNENGNNALHLAYSSQLKLQAIFTANKEAAQRALIARNKKNQTPYRRALNLNKKKAALFLNKKMSILKKQKTAQAALKIQSAKKVVPEKKKRQKPTVTTRKKTRIILQLSTAAIAPAPAKATPSLPAKKAIVDQNTAIQNLIELQNLKWE